MFQQTVFQIKDELFDLINDSILGGGKSPLPS